VLKILQGSVVTQTTLGGLTIYPQVANFLNCICAKLAGSRQSYCKNKQAYFFGPPCKATSGIWQVSEILLQHWVPSPWTHNGEDPVTHRSIMRFLYVNIHLYKVTKVTEVAFRNWYYTCNCYLQLLSSVPASSLHLTKVDNELYSAFRSHFPQLDIKRLDVELIKSAEGKEVSVFVRV